IYDNLQEFYSLREKYLKTPDNFELAYNYVENHPISWIYYFNMWTPHEDNLLAPYFTTENGILKTYWILETGKNDETNYRYRYFDPDISTFKASSAEEAYIIVAKKIEQKYYPNGNPRKIE